VNIVVLVKQVPDSGLERNLRQDDKTVDRDAGNLVIGELDEYAIEEALKLKEAHGGEVTVLTVGPEKATETIRKALSMGPDKAVHVSDAAIHGSDTLATSAIIAAALGKLEYDLVIAGAESTDGQTGALPAILAERLGIAQLTGARKLTVDGDKLTIERQTDDGYEIVEASTPAIVSVWDTINEPRYPSFKGIMQAKKKPVETYSLSDLGISADQVGLDSAWSQVLEFSGRPPKGAGVKVPDEGDGGSKLVQFLAGQKIV
jgi:electron transfer flavoprotein beta subunit